MKIFEFTILFLLTSLFVHAQVMESEMEETDLPRVKRVALGVKLGIPNLTSGSAELILPFLNNHFAPTIEYSKIGLNFENIETNISILNQPNLTTQPVDHFTNSKYKVSIVRNFHIFLINGYFGTRLSFSKYKMSLYKFTLKFNCISLKVKKNKN